MISKWSTKWSTEPITHACQWADGNGMACPHLVMRMDATAASESPTTSKSRLICGAASAAYVRTDSSLMIVNRAVCDGSDPLLLPAHAWRVLPAQDSPSSEKRSWEGSAWSCNRVCHSLGGGVQGRQWSARRSGMTAEIGLFWRSKSWRLRQTHDTFDFTADCSSSSAASRISA